MRVVLLGPPGCGKGTQAQKVCQEWDIPRISTGDILREMVRDGRDVGLRAKEYMVRGALVPDEIVLELVIEKLKEGNARQGFVLDGFPRTLPQARGLDSFLQNAGRPLDLVLYFDVDPETLVRRLSARRICPQCETVYNVITNPPEEEGRCDVCRSELLVREDDREEVVRRRLEVFEEETGSVRDFYLSRGLFFTVDGRGGALEVFERVKEILRKGHING